MVQYRQQREPMVGRPNSFNEIVADEICRRLADGESLRSICDGSDMPSKTTVMKWLAERTEFADQYARAREMQADAIFDEVLEIADDGRNDWMSRKYGEAEVEIVNHEHIARSKLRIEARRWMAGKLAPKKYGDKVAVEHSVDENLAAQMAAAKARADAA